ncbi:hypothetical protein PI125_g18017 [Phytophthora idaei]|nr:hypothetical protein PI125_g18017 [Phytophthora idaei]
MPTASDTIAPVLDESNSVPTVNLEDGEYCEQLEDSGYNEQFVNEVNVKNDDYGDEHDRGDHGEDVGLDHSGDLEQVDQDGDETERETVDLEAQDGECDYQEAKTPVDEQDEIASMARTCVCGFTVCGGNEEQYDDEKDEEVQEDITVASVFC